MKHTHDPTAAPHRSARVTDSVRLGLAVLTLVGLVAVPVFAETAREWQAMTVEQAAARVEAIGSDPAAVDGLSRDEWVAFVDIGLVKGDVRGHQRQRIASVLIERAAGWESLSFDQLRDFSWRLHDINTPRSREAWHTLIRRVWTKYLTDPKFIAEADAKDLGRVLLTSYWRPSGLDWPAGGDFGPIGERLIADPGVFAAMSPVHFQYWAFVDRIAEAWSATERQRGELAAAWVDHVVNHEKQVTGPGTDAGPTPAAAVSGGAGLARYEAWLLDMAMRRMEEGIGRDERVAQRVNQLRLGLREHLLIERIDRDPAGHNLTPEQWSDVYQRLASLSWGDPGEPINLASDRFVIPGLTEHLAAQLAGGVEVEFPYLYNHTAFLARSVRSGAEIDALRRHVVGPDGLPNLFAARLIAWSQRFSGGLADWRLEVDGQLINPSVTGDVKALWLAARAYVEEIDTHREPSPMAGRQWLDQALAHARTEPVRLEVIEAIAERYIQLHRFAEARSLIAGLRGQFESQAAAERFAGIDSRIAGGIRYADQLERAAEARRHQGRIEVLQRRLAEARERNDAERIARYERLLADGGR